MEKKAAIEKILRTAQSNNILGSASGASWAGQSGSLQPQLNEAISQLIEHDNSEPLKGIVATMHLAHLLTDQEYDELTAALDEK